MKWFKHDSDSSIDAKLQELLLDYGAAGYGLYWYCVELIAGKVSPKNITFELEHDARIIARNLNLSQAETKDMMTKMVNLGLFDISQNKKIACYTLANRLDSSMTSNPEMRDIIQKIKANSHDYSPKSHDAVMTVSADGHDKVMQEENRIEENIYIPAKMQDEEMEKKFSLIWKAYSLDFLNKEFERRGGDKQKARKRFFELLAKGYSLEDIAGLVRAEHSLNYPRDLERVLMVKSMKQYLEDMEVQNAG